MRLIDADDLLNSLRKLKVLSLEEKDLFTGPARIAVYARITEQPVIAPESLIKYGEWQWVQGVSEDEYICRCSVCKKSAISHYDEEEGYAVFEKTKHCPNCGAKMKGAEK